MQELVDWYDWAVAAQFKHPLLLIANFVFEYLAIHPFQDGNRRTSRLLGSLMLLQHGYDFVSVVSHERLIEANKAGYYYLALNKTQQSWKTPSEDVTPWLLFFLKIVRSQSELALQLLEGDSFDHLLSEKQLVFWRWVSASPGKEFSRKAAMEALGFPARTVESIIAKLLEMKRIQRLGEGRATRYVALVGGGSKR